MKKGKRDRETQGHRPPTQRAGRRETRPAARGADGRRESGARHSRATISERNEDVSGRRYDKMFGTPE
jgi:hypothetical protein